MGSIAVRENRPRFGFLREIAPKVIAKTLPVAVA